VLIFIFVCVSGHSQDMILPKPEPYWQLASDLLETSNNWCWAGCFSLSKKGTTSSTALDTDPDGTRPANISG